MQVLGSPVPRPPFLPPTDPILGHPPVLLGSDVLEILQHTAYQP